MVQRMFSEAGAFSRVRSIASGAKGVTRPHRWMRCVVGLLLAGAMAAAAPTPATAAAPDFDKYTVPTVSPSGTTVNLFDYWGVDEDHLAVPGGLPAYSNSGINKGHALKFNDGDLNGGGQAGCGEGPNAWTGGAGSYPGIVGNRLVNGYPVLTRDGGLDGSSLSYLFDSSPVAGKSAYIGVQGLLQTHDGYYEYRSSDAGGTGNFASFDAATKRFRVYNTWGVHGAGASQKTNGQFFPFAPIESVFSEGFGGLKQKNVNADAKVLNHHFGLSMSSRFVQPAEGKTQQGKDMVFEFSGDDDVWVFIDDVLVGDLGGIHDEAKLGINFATGAIAVNGESDGTLKGKFDDAGAMGSTQFSGETFAEGTQHTLRFFYLERGAGASNMWLKFNLVTVPTSDIVKLDQHGDPISGAQFELYTAVPAQGGGDWVQGELVASGSTDANGYLALTNIDNGTVVNFDERYEKDETPDKANSTRYLLKETGVPEGYKAPLAYTGDCVRLKYEYSAVAGSGYLTDPAGTEKPGSQMWRNGTSIGGKVLLTATNDLQDNEGGKIDPNGGTLFAVVLERRDSESEINSDSSWVPVYGDPVGGYGYKEVGPGERDIVAAAIEAAKEDPRVFAVNTSGQLQVELDALPGDVSNYYLLKGEAAKNESTYTVAVYHTTAENGLAGATKQNTRLVKSEGFERSFATRLYITNVKDRLFVQKFDDAGEPVAGVEFTLYRADQMRSGADGAIEPNDPDVYFDRLTTQAKITHPVTLEGAGVFPLTADGRKPLTPGTYYLKETRVPEGFELNGEYVRVVVDATGVYADAGRAGDGIETFVGVGNLLSSLGQYAKNGMLNSTLTWIKGTKQTAKGVDGSGFVEWGDPSTAESDTVHLEYGSNGGMLQYGPSTPGGSFRIYSDEGMHRLYIQQADEDKDSGNVSTWTNLGDMQLNQLFTGATCVSVTNNRIASLEVGKRVVAAPGLAPDPTASFPFRFDFTGGGSYRARMFEADGTAVGEADFDLASGGVVRLKAGQKVRVYGIPSNTGYTVRELTGSKPAPTPFNLFGLLGGASADEAAPEGFTLTKRELDGAPLQGEGDSISSTTSAGKTDRLAFTNTYRIERPAALASGTLAMQKVLEGRDGGAWTDADSYTMRIVAGACYRAGADGTLVEDTSATVPMPVFDTVAIDSGVADHAVTFGEIAFTAPGIYTYWLHEEAPEPGKTVPGVTYSSALHRAKVTVADDGSGGLRMKSVELEKLEDDEGNKLAQPEAVGRIDFDENGSPSPSAPLTAVVTNRFTKQTAAVQPQAKKAYRDMTGGNPLEQGKFNFSIKCVAVDDSPDGVSGAPRPNGVELNPDGAWVVPVSENGSVKFGTLTFNNQDHIGHSYTYEMREVVPDSAVTGMTYDASAWRVTYAVSVSPSDAGVRVTAAWQKQNGDGSWESVTSMGGMPTFSNAYNAAPAKLPLNLTKTLDGRDWHEGESFAFDVSVTAGDADAVTLPGAQQGAAGAYTLTQGADGIDGRRATAYTKGFGDIAFSKAGTYELEMAERRGNAAGVTYDTAPRTVTVEVTDDRSGHLVARVRGAQGAAASEVSASFTNAYRATGSFAGIDVAKTMIGRDLAENAFGFTVERTAYDAEGVEIEAGRAVAGPVGCGVAAAGEEFSFAERYGQPFFAGTLSERQLGYRYLFKVTEAPAVADAAGYANDPYAGYVAMYVAADPDDEASLHVEYAVAKGPKTTELVNGSGRAALIVRSNLERLGDEVIWGSAPGSTGSEPACPKVSFVNSYAASDLDYAAAGGLSISKLLVSGTTPSGVSRDFSFMVKPLPTEALAPDGSSSTLTTADEAGRLLGMTPAEIADGKAFATPAVPVNGSDVRVSLLPGGGLTFRQDQIGKRYTFEVREVPGGDAAVTYDDSAYTVTFTVADNGDGRLKVTTQVVKDSYLAVYTYFSGSAVAPGNEAIVPFENDYEADSSTGASRVTPQVVKHIEGGEPRGTAFGFTLVPAPGTDVSHIEGLEEGKLEASTTGALALGRDETVTLGELRFTRAGTYAFDVREDAGSAPGWTYDAHAARYTVTVADEGGKLVATGAWSTDDPAAAAAPATFVNRYDASMPADRRVDTSALFEKVLQGRDWMDSDRFSFTLSPRDGAPAPSGGTSASVGKDDVADGVARFGFGYLGFDAPGVYVYEVTEDDIDAAEMPGVAKDPSAAVLTVIVRDDGDGTLSASTSVEHPRFVNTYRALELDAAAATGFDIVKILDGRTLAAGQFSFTVRPADRASARKLGIPEEGATYGNAAGSASAGASSDAAEVARLRAAESFTGDDAGKVYSYAVSEIVGSQAGYTYDDAVYTVAVSTADDPATAKLTVTTRLMDAKGNVLDTKTVTSGDAPAAPVRIEFRNAYSATGTEQGGAAHARVRAEKVLTGRSLAPGEFAFAVSNMAVAAAGDDAVATASNAADGTIAFAPLSYTLETLQADAASGRAQVEAAADGAQVYAYRYMVAEVGEMPAGVTGVETSFPIRVEVTDDGAGALSARVVYPDGMADGLTFTNAYGADAEAEVAISGVKELEVSSGDNPPDITGAYTFTIAPAKGYEGAPLPQRTEASNDRVGAVDFGTVAFSLEDAFGDEGSAGAVRERVYAYEVTESGTVPGVKNDAEPVKRVEVTVRDNGDGTMSASASAVEGGGSFRFVNAYGVEATGPTSVTDAIAIQKVLTGRDLREGEFSFELVETVDGEERVVATGVNDADGAVELAGAVYDRPGVHDYLLREVRGNAGGVTYDATVHAVRTTVVDNGDGTLGVEHVLLGADGLPAKDQAVTFTNAYAPVRPASVSFGVGKRLEGAELAGGRFAFELVDGDGTVVATARNDADGIAAFPAMTFDEPGSHGYSVHEVDDGQEGVRYDATVYAVRIEAADDGDGGLAVQVRFFAPDGEQLAAPPVFVNAYEEPEDPGENPGESPGESPGENPGGPGDKPGDGSGGNRPGGEAPGPGTGGKPALPGTGDAFSPTVMGAVALGGAGLVVAGIVLARRRKG